LGEREKARELHELIKNEALAAYITRQISKNLAGHYWGLPGFGETGGGLGAD
jgi:hypothetical protein